jgi:hypothetical protein
MHSEEQIYRAIINELRSSLADLDYCFASDEAKQALYDAIQICEKDWESRLEPREKPSKPRDQ